MSKAAWIGKEVKERLNGLALRRPYMSSEDIEAALKKEFSNREDFNPIPKLSTIEKKVREFRNEAKGNIQEQPWSIGAMASGNTGIPWEAVGFLLKVSDELRRKGENLWPYSAEPYAHIYEGTPASVAKALASGEGLKPAKVKPGAPKVSADIVITNRQAKWLWRIHTILPELALSEKYRMADSYAYGELIAEYLGDVFDTAGLDGELKIFLKEERRNKP